MDRKELSYECNAEKAYALVALGKHKEAKDLIKLGLDQIVLEAIGNSDRYPASKLVATYYDLLSLTEAEMPLESMFEVSTYLVKGFTARYDLKDELFSERARLISLSMMLKKPDVINEQIAKLKKKMKSEYEDSVYRYYVDLVGAIQLAERGEKNEAVAMLKTWDQNGWYGEEGAEIEYNHLVYLTQLELKSLSIKEAEQRLERINELDERRLDITNQMPFRFIQDFMVDKQELIARVDDKKTMQLDRFRRFVTSKVDDLGFKKAKKAFTKRSEYQETSLRFFTTFADPYSFAMINKSEFKDAKEDFVIFPLVLEDDGFRRNVIYIDTKGRKLRAGALGTIEENNIQFFHLMTSSFLLKPGRHNAYLIKSRVLSGRLYELTKLLKQSCYGAVFVTIEPGCNSQRNNY